MYHLTEAYLMSALICLLAAFFGALLFSVATSRANDPVISSSSPMRGSHQPARYGFAACSTAVFTAIIAGAAPFSAVPIIYTLLVVSVSGLMSTLFLIAWRLQPVIRQAEVDGNRSRLQRLRTTARLMFGGGILLTLLVIVALVYILPGHFTYYPTQPDAVPSLLV